MNSGRGISALCVLRLRRRVATTALILAALLMGSLPPLAAADTSTSQGTPAPGEPGTTAAAATSRLSAGDEVVERRTATSKTFATADADRFTTKISAAPIHYRGGNGRWLDLDLSLASDGSGGFRPRGVGFGLRIAASASARELAQIDLGQGRSAAFGLNGAGNPRAVVAGASVRYPKVYPGVDLRLETTALGVKEELVLASRSAQNVFDFRLDLTGLEVEKDAAGGLEYRDAAGDVALRTPPGWAEDSARKTAEHRGSVTGDVDFDLLPGADGSTTLRVTLDRAWLDDSARVFPVTIDPTWMVGAHINQAYYSGGVTEAPGQVQVGNPYQDCCNVWRSTVYFPYEDLFGKVIDGARVHLFNMSSGTTSAYDVCLSHATSFSFNGYDPYSEMCVVASGWAANFYNGQVLSQYRTAINNQWRGWSLSFAGNESQYQFTYKKFFSFELHIDWREPNRAPNVPDTRNPFHGWMGTSSPTLSARYTDPDGNGGNVDFEMPGGCFCPVATSNGNTAYWNPGVGDGVYSWRVRGWDGQYHSAWSDHWTFTVDGTKPGLPAIGSSTHPSPNVWYKSRSASVNWSATDTAPINGYSWALDSDADTSSKGAGTSTTFNNLSDGSHFVSVRARNGTNLWGDAARFTLSVDGTNPSKIGPITSSHVPFAGSTDRTIDASWTPASDTTSGIAGYSVAFNRSRLTPADDSADTTAPQTSSGELADGDWWLHVRAVDRAGNAGDDAYYGPIRIDGAGVLGGLTSSTEAQSDQVGLEQFAPYDDFDLGTGTGYVHLGSGNAVATFEDATIPAQGLNVVVRHTYNSARAGIDNGLGKGWSLSVTDLEGDLDDVEGAITDIDVNRALAPLEVGEVIDGVYQITGSLLEFTDGDGTTHRFVRKGAPGARWDSPPGVSLRVIEQIANGITTGYDLVRPDGVRYEARRTSLTNPSWRVTAVADRNGNRLSYGYGEFGGNTRLTEIRHNRDNRLMAQFQYDTDARLQVITTLPGTKTIEAGGDRLWERKITYAVNATTGRLDQVTDNTHPTPVGGTAATRSTSFGYDAATGLLNRVTDGRNKATTLGYTAENGRQLLTSVTDRRAKTWQWKYGTIDPTTGVRTTTAYTPLETTTNAALGTKYKVSGRGPVNAPTDLRVTGGNILEIRDAGTDAGPVVTSFEWVANRLVATTDATGAKSQTFYDDLGMVTKVIEPAPNDPTQPARSGAPTQPVESTIEYRYPPGSQLPNCTQPATSGTQVTNANYCQTTADMRRVVHGANVAGQSRITDFNPTDAGNLLSVTERGAPDLASSPDAAAAAVDRRTSFEYYARGGLRRIDGPRTDTADVTVWGNDVATDIYGGYDVTGMPLRIVDALNKTKTFTYSPYGMTRSVTDRDNNRTTSEYDERDNLAKVTDALGRNTSFTYDGNDNKTSETSEANLQTTWTYDDNDQLLETSEPGSGVTGEPLLGISKLTYRADGSKETSTNRAGATTTFTYHPNQALAEMLEPAEGTSLAATTYNYDTAGRLRRTISPKANAAGNRPVAETTYTPQGQPRTERSTSSLGVAGNTDRLVEHYYNAHGEEVETLGPRTDPANGVRQRTTVIVDPFGQPTETRRWLDAARYLPSIVGYDLGGNQTTTLQPAGTDASPTTIESRYTFDALNRLDRQTLDETNPGHEVTYRYSNEGQQTHRIDEQRSGSTLTPVRTAVHAYNSDNTRRSTITTDHVAGTVLATCNYDDAANPTAGYDPEGHLLVTHTRTGGCANADPMVRTQRLGYDNRGWLRTSTQQIVSPQNGQQVTRTQSFKYNPDGTRTEGTHANNTTSYELTPAAWMDAAVDWKGQRTEIDHLDSGAPREIRFGGHATGAFTYAVDGMPSALAWTKASGAAVRAHTAIAYDIGGLRTTEHVRVVQPDGTITEGDSTFGYDLDDRLTRYTSPFKHRTSDTVTPQSVYTLDRSGNITDERMTVSGVERTRATSNYIKGRLDYRTTTEVADSPLRLGATTVTDTFTYNVLGEEKRQDTQKATQQIRGIAGTTVTTNTITGHDPVGHTKSVDNSDQAQADVTYVYDTSDRVISRTETKNGVATTTLYFYWGTGGALAEEADGLGNAKVLYLVDTGDETLAQQSYATDANGNRNLSDTAGTWTWLLQDTAGNTATRLRSDGTIVEQAAYDPYGRPEVGGSKKRTGDTTPSTLGFQGHIQDKATGAVILGARQYDPASARFTTPDSFVAGALDLQLGTDSLTGNRYLFAAANPVAYYEDGHWPSLKSIKGLAKKALPLLSFVPVVGTAIDVVSAATGRDLLNGGRKLSGAERAVMLAGAAVGMVPGAGAGAKAALKVAAKGLTKKAGAKAVVAAAKHSDDLGRVGRTSDKLVLGETMKRVRAAASVYGAKTYEPEIWHKGLGSTYRNFRDNFKFIRSEMKKNTHFIDIGRDPTRSAKAWVSRGGKGPSMYYTMERMMIRGYRYQNVSRVRWS